jgi:hypothetical protein
VSYNSKKIIEAASDRMGVFRLQGLPPGRLGLFINKEGYGRGSASIPDEAVEVDIILPPGAEPD